MRKQTQTKLFDFSDVGLDFCAGSKNLFPDRFKKMLVLGYNEQTVSSVTVAGNQVTFTYGGTHGYVADRVLKVNAPELLSVNGGEFVIDSVTENTVTMTIDGAPTFIAGNFTTKVASLGWSLEYEQDNIHIYKLKAYDESYLYLRLCFQDVAARRNSIAPCIGTSVDLDTGFITDEHSLATTSSVMSPTTTFKWEFGSAANTTADSYTYSQGYATYGNGLVVGSKYHLLFLTHGSGSSVDVKALTNGVFPSVLAPYDNLQKAALLGYEFGTNNGTINAYTGRYSRCKSGEFGLRFWSIPANATSMNYLFETAYFAPSATLPSNIDAFNTTALKPLELYNEGTGQYLGYGLGFYNACAKGSDFPTLYQNSPSFTHDIDFEKIVLIHASGTGNSVGTNTGFYGVVIEEVI